MVMRALRVLIPVVVLALAGSAATYTVRPGDTLSAVAVRLHVPLASLIAANHVRNPDRIVVGQQLVVPGTVGPPPLACPVRGGGTVVSRFGDPRGGGVPHQGVDVAAPAGRLVVANVDGVLVRDPNPRGGLGYILRGRDGNSYYGAHLREYVAGNGSVHVGQVIGTVGESGDAYGTIPHLHFEWWPR